MRALAVSGVIYAHFAFLLLPAAPRLAFARDAALSGVAVFFCLSGFLVGSIALRRFYEERQPGSIPNFLGRRWLRTLPAYYVFLVLNSTIVGWDQFDWKYLFFLQTMTGKEPLPYFNESWTLAIEEWFYLLLPFLLLLLVRLKPLTPIIPLAGLAIFCIASRYILRAYVGLEWRDTHHITLLNFDSLLMGVIAAYIHRTYQAFWSFIRWPGLIAGLLLLLGGSVPVDAGPFSSVFTTSQYGLAAALLLPAAVSWKRPPPVLGRSITWIALISYSLYLSHIPMALILTRTGVLHLTSSCSLFNSSVWLAASVALAVASYLLVERTGMRIANTMEPRGRHRVNTAENGRLPQS